MLRHHSGFRHLCETMRLIWSDISSCRSWLWTKRISTAGLHGVLLQMLWGNISLAVWAVTSWGCLQLSLVTGCWCTGGPAAGFLHMGKKLIFSPNHVRFYRTSILDIYCPLSLLGSFTGTSLRLRLSGQDCVPNWGAWVQFPVSEPDPPCHNQQFTCCN